MFTREEMVMNSRQRIAAAMRHEMPDRVAVMCQLAAGYYFLHSDQHASDIWFDSRTFVTTLEQFCRKYRFDGFLINLPGRPSNWRDYLVSRESTDKLEKLAWRNGLKTWFPPDDCGQTLQMDDTTLPRVRYDTIDPDDPSVYRTSGYLWNTWHAPTLWDIPADADLTDPAAYPQWYTLGLRTARAACPDLSVHQEVFSPFTHLLELFGYDQALMALLDTPETCERVLDRFAAMVCAQVLRYAEHQPDAILISSAFAGAGFISREMYQRFVIPYEKRVVSAIKRCHLPSYVHTCGAIGDRLDLMAQTGVDGIDTLDPPPLGTVDLAKAKAEFGERFFFKGNLDAVNEMLRAPDDVFEQAVRERLRIGMPGSGYILSSACSVAPHVLPERLSRMVELAEAFGRYDRPRRVSKPASR